MLWETSRTIRKRVRPCPVPPIVNTTRILLDTSHEIIQLENKIANETASRAAKQGKAMDYGSARQDIEALQALTGDSTAADPAAIITEWETLK